MNRIGMAAKVATAALLLTTAACGGNTLGTLGDILGGAVGQPGAQSSGELRAEVRSIDTQRQEIQVATEQGQTGAVRYDQNTAVTYRQQQYQVSALERGDVVRMQVQETSQGALYVSRIEVEQSVQERSGNTGTGALQQYTGRVGQIDYDRGVFLLQTQNGNLTVSLPYNPPQATVDYFRRLRSGDTVRLEATSVGTARVEIYRFL